MGSSKPTQPSVYSANSKNIKRFQLSQRFGNLAFIAIIAVPVILGSVAYATYKRMTAPSSDDTEIATLEDAPGTMDFNQPINDMPPTGPVADEQLSGGAGSGASGRMPPSNSQARASNSAPEGVIVAINSIEANGIKNNPYVQMDTSNIPDGAVVSVNRNSWVSEGPDSGTISGTITFNGQPYNGSVVFNNIGGTWKVVSYYLG